MSEPAVEPQTHENPADATGGEEPLRSVHTPSFPQILETLRASLMVSTYQAGKLILLRNERGTLNTHFRGFDKPMGVALRNGRLAIGTRSEIWEFHNVPDTARRLPEDANKVDACFVPRACHITGDIHIHEMDWGDDGELWYVNTQFSCLCTRDVKYSFVPRWRPNFITGYAPQDYCHLNGLAMVDGKPKYVTALGETDKPAGWRDKKARGGILMDVDSGEIITRGLSMPHSPRLYNGRLWVLNSGDGEIGTVDLQSGKYESVLQLPGFTRGLSFCGPLAFVGLSQVRESAIFSGIKIAERPQDQRWSGVAIVNLERGELAGFVRFEQAVQEVFAVGVVPNSVWPDVINDDRDVVSTTYVLPDEALKEVPQDWREAGKKSD